MLLPFRNVTRAAAHDWLTTGAPLLLAETLGQFNDLQVVPEARLTAARRRLGLSPDAVPDESQLRRLAEETGGWTYVTGNIIAGGAGLRITAEAFDAVTSKSVGRGAADVPMGADVRGAFDQITAQLLQPVGIKSARTDVVALTTKSIDAYRSYVDGIAFMQRGAYRRAEQAFADAVRRDSMFAIAWVKLGTAAIQSRGLTELINPLGITVRAVERAGRASASLPPRTTAAVLALQHLFHGEVGRSRQTADSLVATDPDDVDALAWSSIINFFDTRIDPVTGRRLGSLNTSIGRAKRALERDPGRQEMYLVPATIYAFGAGFLGNTVGGRRRPVSSLSAELMTPADVDFVVAVEDSIVLVPDSTYARWPRGQRDSATRRAADAGIAWTQRWQAANPTDPEPHVWASRYEELRLDYARSLVELNQARALGVESNLENLTARRAFLLEMTAQPAAAEATADSLLASRSFRTRPFSLWIDRSRVIVPAILLRSKQWEKLMSLAPMLDSTVAPCYAIEREMTEFSMRIPVPMLRALADTVVNHYSEILESPARACADAWARGMVYDSAQINRPAAARRLWAVAESLHAAGNESGAYRAARVAGIAESARRVSIYTIPWVDTLARRFEAGTQFQPGEAVVDGDSLTVTFRHAGEARLTLDPAGIALARSFMFTTGPAGPDSAVFRIQLFHPGPAADTVRRGSLAEFAAGFTDVTARLTARGKPPLNAQALVSVSSSALRVVVRGSVVGELRRLAPATGRQQALCPISGAGICRPQTIAISYH